MEREAKAKVIASVWGVECIQFLAALAVLPRLIWKKRLNSNRPGQNSKGGKELNKLCLHPSSTVIPLGVRLRAVHYIRNIASRASLPSISSKLKLNAKVFQLLRYAQCKKIFKP